MPEERTPEEAAEAMRREALRMAIEHHARSASHPNSRGPAKPTTVTSTAHEFLIFLRDVAERAGVEADDLDLS